MADEVDNILWAALGLGRVEAAVDVAAERLVENFLRLLARGVIQFAPEAPQAELDDTGSAPFRLKLSPLEKARILGRKAAGLFEQAGEVSIAVAIIKAIEPKRGRGRPPEWQPADVLSLWSDVMDLARRNPQFTDRSIFELLAKKTEWQGHTYESLRQKFSEGANKLGMKAAGAIAELRALGS